MSATLRVRDARAADLPVLEAMLFEAFFWRRERERPSLNAFRSDAEFQKWVRGFGEREGDRAVIAERVGEHGATPVGADSMSGLGATPVGADSMSGLGATPVGADSMSGLGATPVGAAFHRLFTNAEHSYGFIDEATPEIAIGVAADARGEGVGRALMQALVERARADGVRALSLSVEPDNFARQLYQGLGFERIATVEGAWTMKLALTTLLAALTARFATALASHAALGVVALAVAGCGGPFFIIPGGELRGEVSNEPVTDWSFADDTFIDLEVRPADPYSIELNYFVREGRLYVDPAEGRTWLDYLRADPNVRVRLDGRIYPVTAVLVSRPGEPSGLDAMDPERFIYRLDSRVPGSP